MSKDKNKHKTSSARHTRAIQRDRSKRPSAAPPDEKVEALLEELIHPATYTQMALYHEMGMRQRILTLPLMVAFVTDTARDFVLGLIWRQLGSVTEAVRELNRHGLLWSG